MPSFGSAHRGAEPRFRGDAAEHGRQDCRHHRLHQWHGPGSHADLRGPGCARVVMLNRPPPRADSAQKAQTGPGIDAMHEPCDLQSSASVRAPAVRAVPWPAHEGQIPRPRDGPAARNPKILTYLIAADAEIAHAGSPVYSCRFDWPTWCRYRGMWHSRTRVAADMVGELTTGTAASS